MSAASDRSRTLADGVSRRALVGAGVFGFGFSGLIDVLLIHHILQCITCCRASIR